MRFEYVLLICAFVLPTIYKIWLWQNIFDSRSNEVRKIWKFLKSKQGSDALLHFWIFLELPLFALCIVPFFNPPFEIFLFSIMFYFALLYNIFVIWKILRKKILYPKVNRILLLTVLVILCDWILSFLIDVKYLYVFLASLLLFMPIYLLVTLMLLRVKDRIFSKNL